MWGWVNGGIRESYPVRGLSTLVEILLSCLSDGPCIRGSREHVKTFLQHTNAILSVVE